MFVDFHNHLERQLSSRLIYFQSDWGCEFQALSQYLKHHGIIHHVSCQHTLEKNGTIERKHRHFIETCLSLLTKAHMPSKFCDESVLIVVYLINRLPTLVLKNRSFLKVLFREQPKFEILKTFGCLCYPNLRPYSHIKLTV